MKIILIVKVSLELRVEVHCISAKVEKERERNGCGAGAFIFIHFHCTSMCNDRMRVEVEMNKKKKFSGKSELNNKRPYCNNNQIDYSVGKVMWLWSRSTSEGSLLHACVCECMYICICMLQFEFHSKAQRVRSRNSFSTLHHRMDADIDCAVLSVWHMKWCIICSKLLSFQYRLWANFA